MDIIISVARVRHHGENIHSLIVSIRQIWEDKEFLSFISGKQEWESPPSILVTSVARVRCRGDCPPPSSSGVVFMSILADMGRQGILVFLSVEYRNGSRDLVFWSLGTLTGLKDQVRRLVV
jgi:hypothetical protein